MIYLETGTNSVALDLSRGATVSDPNYIITFINIFDKTAFAFSASYSCSCRYKLFDIGLTSGTADYDNGLIKGVDGQYFYNVYATSDTIDQTYLDNFIINKQEEFDYIYSSDYDGSIETGRAYIKN